VQVGVDQLGARIRFVVQGATYHYALDSYRASRPIAATGAGTQLINASMITRDDG